MNIKICTALVAMLAVAGCSGMVAPTNEGSGPSSTKTTTSKTTTGDTTGGETTGGETTGGETTGGETTGGETTGGEETTTDTPIGTFTGATEDGLEFTGKSAYAQITEAAGKKSFYLSLTTSTTTEDSLTKEVEEWECVKCEGECETTSGTAKTITIMFSDYQDYTDPLNPATVDVVDDNGFPAKDAFERKTPTAQGATVTYSGDGKNYAGGLTTGNVITFKTRPSKVGDEFEVDIDAKFVAFTASNFDTPEGSYKVNIKTKVVPNITQPTAPSCKEDEKLTVKKYKS